MKKVISTAIVAALTLGAIAAPAHARFEQDGEYEFTSWGACSAYLNRMHRNSARGTDSYEVARWDAAYCLPVAFKHIVIVFPI